MNAGQQSPFRAKLAVARRWYWNNCVGELRRARHYLEQSNRRYARLVAEAKKRGDSNEVESIEAEWSADVDGDRSDYDLAQTHYWMRRAARYHVPTPEYNDTRYWNQSSYDGRYHLTVAGIDDVEKRIDEKRARNASIFSARVTPTIGIIGAVTGLAAVLAHC